MRKRHASQYAKFGSLHVLQILDLIHIILKLRITLKEYEGNF